MTGSMESVNGSFTLIDRLPLNKKIKRISFMLLELNEQWEYRLCAIMDWFCSDIFVGLDFQLSYLSFLSCIT